MKSLSFGNFQVGIVNNPSVEDKGGFEFASGMDIFSEAGVLKACNAMEPVILGTGAALNGFPTFMVDTATPTEIRAYIAAGTKILESTDGITWNLFRTNANGVNSGLAIWAGYVIYIAATTIGRTLVGNASAANDSYITTLDSDDFHPALPQGGTLKIGVGRYVASLDESFNFTPRAMKLASDYKISCLTEYLTSLYMGTRFGTLGGIADSSVFAWRGTILSSGSALPDTPYPMKLRGMNALLADGNRLYAFPDTRGDILIFDGSGFVDHRNILPVKQSGGALVVSRGGVSQHKDNTILFSGDMTTIPGVYQMKDKAICQAFVPSVVTPGVDSVITVGFVKSAFNGDVFIGYYRLSDFSYHIERSGSNKQNNAIVRTLWHRIETDKMKRWGGVKLNLKPLASGCSVAVAYRTSRTAAFTDSGYTITSSNQDKPVIFAAQPRSREIQFKFTYATNTANTPELLSYDPLFDVLKTVR
jgi:hypothetical protein